MPPAGTRITQVYDKALSGLLILGEPGSGKTTMLLELARDLLSHAETDNSYPLPMVFNLSSWAVKRQPLVEEMNTMYQVSRRLGQAWVQADQVLPLLDGLDEVAPPYRGLCGCHQRLPRGTRTGESGGLKSACRLSEPEAACWRSPPLAFAAGGHGTNAAGGRGRGHPAPPPVRPTVATPQQGSDAPC